MALCLDSGAMLCMQNKILTLKAYFLTNQILVILSFLFSVFQNKKWQQTYDQPITLTSLQTFISTQNSQTGGISNNYLTMNCSTLSVSHHSMITVFDVTDIHATLSDVNALGSTYSLI